VVREGHRLGDGAAQSALLVAGHEVGGRQTALAATDGAALGAARPQQLQLALGDIAAQLATPAGRLDVAACRVTVKSNISV